MVLLTLETSQLNAMKGAHMYMRTVMPTE